MKISQKLRLNSLVVLVFLVLNVAVFLVQRMMGDERTLAFADYSGNRQYIIAGNLSENNKAVLFLMDYPNRRRIKIWGAAQVVEDDPELLEEKISDPEYPAKIERAFVFYVEAWDANCPQHIMERFTVEELSPVL